MSAWVLIVGILLLGLASRGAGQGTAPKSGAPADLKSMREITGVEKLPPAPPRAQWPLWLGLALGASVFVLLCGWRLSRTLTRAAPAVPPERWAVAELERIDRMALPAAGQVERYHTLVSDVVRRYLELRFSLYAPRQTTAEFLGSMRRSPEFSKAQQTLLQEFLERCDLAKFARAGFSPEECMVTGRMAREIVARTGWVT